MLCKTLNRLLRFHPLAGDQFATRLACVKAVQFFFPGQSSQELTTQTRHLFSNPIQIHSPPRPKALIAFPVPDYSLVTSAD